MVVIIGAGPAGLYTAIQLKKAGIKDLVVYDPRAGIYTRPGHINLEVVVKAGGFEIDKSVPIEGNFAHLKTFERGLYKQALDLGIKFENKRFLRMHVDAKAPGVVVDDGSEAGELVPADFVFDCSGQKRAVIDAVNKADPEKPFELEQFTNVPVKNHFLAYIKVSETNWKEFFKAFKNNNYTDSVPALYFARSIIKLRALGWKEFTLPNSYGANFGSKNGEVKVCTYFHTPDNLARDNHENWVQTVLECYVPNITYQHMPPSKKFKNKPRFLPFTTNAQILNKVSYQGKNLPTVIALGDAQIDFDYVQANGIYDGLDRIKSLLKHIQIKEGKISYFNSDVYKAMIESQLYTHKTNVIRGALLVQKRFDEALETSQLKLRQASKETSIPEERILIADILKEIDVRQSYTRGRQGFYKFHNVLNRLNPYFVTQIVPSLENTHNDLLKACAGLPAYSVKEKQEAPKLLINLAISWKEIGNDLFKRSDFSSAIEAYKKAAEIYNAPGFVGNYVSSELAIYSNLANVYNKMNRYPEAIAAAKLGLSHCEQVTNEPKVPSFKEKFVYNLIKALCSQAQNLLTLNNNNEAQALHAQIQDLDLNQVQNDENRIALDTMIKELALKLPKESGAVKYATSGVGSPNAEALKKLGTFADAKNSLGVVGQEVKTKSSQGFI